jgi:outer membrane receptor protein involved in Fe transport
MKNRAHPYRRRGFLAYAAVASAVAAALEIRVQAQAGDAGLEEIFVTGSRISRQGFDAPTPVTAIDSDYLLDLGYVNVGAAVQQLPINKASLTPETNGFGSFNVGAQIVNLRALGSNRTLTLVDGRRHIPSTDTGNVDLNLIPPLLLERTEVVTGGASAAYGSDALAGVVNVILDKDLEGLRLQADYYETGEGDGKSVHLSGAGGTSLFDGRAHLIIGAEYEDAEGIDSCMLNRDWCSNLPGVITNSLSATNGEPRNIITDNVRMGGMTSGGLIVGTNFVGAGYVPGSNGAGNGIPPTLATTNPFYGRQFDAAGNLVPFQNGAYYNNNNPNQRGGDGFSRGETVNVRVPVERLSIFSHLNFELTDTTNLFFEVSAGAVDSWNLGAARWFNNQFSVLIHRDNPYLPAAAAQIMDANAITSFRLGKHWDDWGRVESHSNNDVYRLVVGANGALSDGWTWDTYYQLGYNSREQYLLRQSITTNHYRALNAATNPANGQPICRDLLSTDPAVVAAAAGCVPLNPFGTNNWDPAARDYALGTLEEWYKMNEYVVAANVQGEIFDVGGGPVGVAAGMEYRVDSGAITHDECGLRSCYWQNYGDDFAGDLEVTEGYVETAMPFIRDKRGARLLELDAAIRQTHYRNSQPAHTEHHNDGTDEFVDFRSSTIDATTFKFSALYDPTDWLRFRATKSRDIRAPNFDELYSRTESLGFTGVSNPWTGIQDTPISITSGNVDLDPEEGDTMTLGVVFSPNWSWGEGFRLSVDWWDIEIHGAVSRLGVGPIVTQCYAGNQELCELIDTPGSTITEVRNATLNLDVYETSGVDVEAAYNLPLDGGADLGFRLFATRTDEVATIIGGVKTDYAGVTGGNAFAQPEWSLNGTISYSRDAFSVSLQGRYIDSGLNNVLWLQPGDPGYSPASTFSTNDNTVPSAFYTTLAARYTLPMRTERSWELFASINNLTDQEPPIVPTGDYPTNPAFFDQVGRAVRFGVRADF